MKKILAVGIAGLLMLALMVSGCATATSPVRGVIYGKVKAPLIATNLQESSKKGTAICKSILGVVAVGDCSIEAAMKQGKISKVHHVDYESMNILFVYSTFATIVLGE